MILKICPRRPECLGMAAAAALRNTEGSRDAAAYHRSAYATGCHDNGQRAGRQQLRLPRHEQNLLREGQPSTCHNHETMFKGSIVSDPIVSAQMSSNNSGKCRAWAARVDEDLPFRLFVNAAIPVPTPDVSTGVGTTQAADSVTH